MILVLANKLPYICCKHSCNFLIIIRCPLTISNLKTIFHHLDILLNLVALKLIMLKEFGPKAVVP